MMDIWPNDSSIKQNNYSMMHTAQLVHYVAMIHENHFYLGLSIVWVYMQLCLHVNNLGLSQEKSSFSDMGFWYVTI